MLSDLQLFVKLTEKLLQEEQLNPVAAHLPAEEMKSRMDLSLPETPTIEEDFVKALEALVLQTPRTATRLFFNQLFGGRQSKAVLGDLLAVMLNNSMYTYKVAGVQVGVEQTILQKVAEMIGYGRDAGGTLAPGGSMTNLMAMLMARDRKNAAIRQEGIQGKYTVYTSSDSHYSIPKNAAFMGIGRQQVRLIPTNDRGEMLVAALEAQIRTDLAAGFQPILVIATAGTTVLGAFDPIEPISKVCKEYDCWLHVDGAYCGAVLFSRKFRHLIQGVEKTDSFSFNAHKMLGTPLSCSLILTRHKQQLYESFSNDAAYLYQTDDDYNLGKTSLQCGRRNDALKLWTLWKAVGTQGLEEMVDHQFKLADVAREYIRKHPDYTLYSFDKSISVCFNYKDIPAPALCTMLYEESELMVGYGAFREQQFVRLVTINANNSEAEIIQFFKKMETAVEKHLPLVAN